MKDSGWHSGRLGILTLNLAISAAADEFQSVWRWPGLFPVPNSTSLGRKWFKMLTRLWCTRVLVELQRTQLAHTTQISSKAPAMWQTSRPLTGTEPPDAAKLSLSSLGNGFFSLNCSCFCSSLPFSVQFLVPGPKNLETLSWYLKYL